MARVLIGVSVGSGVESADAAVVRIGGVGLGIAPTVERSVRVPFPPAIGTRGIADVAGHAIRTLVMQAGLSARDLFAVGLLEPGRSHDASPAWAEVADRIADLTGLSVVHGFRGRDRAAGGSGHPIAATADFLLFRHDREDRLLIHLGAVSSVLFLPANAKLSAIVGFDAGPGRQLLDAILHHGTRGKEHADTGGKKAVQGRCFEPLLTRWMEHPHLTRPPPKTVHADAFGRSFLHAAFDAARELGAGLPDLLCTANHLVARAVGDACRTWLPAGARQVLLTGGGVRNGFLWQLLGQQFEGVKLARTDEMGIPAAARVPAAAAVLAALTCDGVAGNLAPLTGAAGGRLLGHIVPGDARNWARCASWIADQAGEYPRVNRAA